MKRHGVDCSCEECGKIRDVLFKKGLNGTAYIAGTKEDKEKLKK